MCGQVRGGRFGERAVVQREFAGDAAVDPERFFRQRFEEAAVVADEDDGGAQALDRLF